MVVGRYGNYNFQLTGYLSQIDGDIMNNDYWSSKGTDVLFPFFLIFVPGVIYIRFPYATANN